jgi:AraC-like DNA-binding protein/mannose-6-phosphate isomerase-like protein (cupin superfamily)
LPKKFAFSVTISTLRLNISLLNLLQEWEQEEPPESMTQLHYHAGFELHGVTSGECRMRIDGTDRNVREGELCLIPPGVYHVQKQASEQFFKLTLQFEPEGPPRDHRDTEGWRIYDALQKLRQSKPLVTVCPERLRFLQEAMRETARDRDRLLAAGSALQMMTALYILELTQFLSDQAPSGRGVPEKLSGEQTRNAIIEDYFSRNFRPGGGAETLAHLLNVSRRQLDRILIASYGKSFREMLLEARLEVALDLLRTGDRSTAEIAELLGYGSPANFSTFIKQQTGRTPAELRRKADSKEK